MYAVQDQVYPDATSLWCSTWVVLLLLLLFLLFLKLSLPCQSEDTYPWKEEKEKIVRDQNEQIRLTGSKL